MNKKIKFACLSLLSLPLTLLASCDGIKFLGDPLKDLHIALQEFKYSAVQNSFLFAEAAKKPVERLVKKINAIAKHYKDKKDLNLGVFKNFDDVISFYKAEAGKLLKENVIIPTNGKLYKHFETIGKQNALIKVKFVQNLLSEAKKLNNEKQEFTIKYKTGYSHESDKVKEQEVKFSDYKGVLEGYDLSKNNNLIEFKIGEDNYDLSKLLSGSSIGNNLDKIEEVYSRNFGFNNADFSFDSSKDLATLQNNEDNMKVYLNFIHTNKFITVKEEPQKVTTLINDGAVGSSNNGKVFELFNDFIMPYYDEISATTKQFFGYSEPLSFDYALVENFEKCAKKVKVGDSSDTIFDIFDTKVKRQNENDLKGIFTSFIKDKKSKKFAFDNQAEDKEFCKYFIKSA